MSKLVTLWSSHLSDKQSKEDFEGYVRNSSSLLERLSDILKQKVVTLSSPRDDYDSPAWACKQADRNGQLRVLNDILKLTDLERNDPWVTSLLNHKSLPQKL